MMKGSLSLSLSYAIAIRSMSTAHFVSLDMTPMRQPAHHSFNHLPNHVSHVCSPAHPLVQSRDGSKSTECVLSLFTPSSFLRSISRPQPRAIFDFKPLNLLSVRLSLSQIMLSSGALHVPTSPAPTTSPTYGQRLSRSPSYMEVFGLADERCVE